MSKQNEWKNEKKKRQKTLELTDDLTANEIKFHHADKINALIMNKNKNKYMTSPWSKSEEHEFLINYSRGIRNLKHGMYASIPIICRGNLCPYKDNCPLYGEEVAPIGDKCPIEIAAIQDLTERYFKDLNIDDTDPHQAIDVMMVKDLVDIDISMLRCENKMAVTADFVIENVVGMTENYESITRQELHPILEFKEKLRQMKFKTLQLLNSTRKDKEGQRIVIEDPSQKAAKLMKLRNEIQHIDHESHEEEMKYYQRLNQQTVIEVDGS